VARIAVSAVVAGLSVACAHPRADAVGDVLEAVDAEATRISWPGYAPSGIPLVLYDDEATYLMRHPAPPEPFRRMRGRRDAWVADTLLSGMSANTDVDLGGVRTAVARVATAPDGSWDAGVTASVLLHEAFHAWQSEAHPEWTANEVDLFTYPFRSAELLRLRRLEGGALRRAVTAPDSLRELCWAQAFLREREARFDRLPEAARKYERMSELREGLAQYVEALALGKEPELPADGYPPEDVRERVYATGQAQAVLLDRLAPGWKRRLVDAEEPVTLASLLQDAIGGLEVRRCGASPDEAARAGALARSDSAALARRDARALAGFEDAAGWRVEIEVEGEPLQPVRFDPLNIRVLDERTVLHTRWISVANDVISAESLGHTVLTRGRPGHPLFAGLDRFRVTGLREPEVTTSGDTIRIAGDGLTVTAIGATLDAEGQRIRVIGR